MALTTLPFTPPSPVAVAVAGERLLREVVRQTCARRGLAVAAESPDYAGLARACARLDEPVAIVADRIGEDLVEDFLDELTAAGVRVVVVSADPSPERLNAILARDVCGYFSADARPDELVTGVLAAARGEVSLNAEVATKVVRHWRRLVAPDPATRRMLTRRETDVLEAMTDGLATKVIAARLGIAPKTVENHKLSIFKKLGARNQAHAVMLAFTGAALRAPA